MLPMRQSDDLLNVVVSMFQEMQRIGVETPVCAFLFVNEEAKQADTYSAFVHPHKSGMSWTSSALVEINEEIVVGIHRYPLDPDWDEDLQRWRKGQMWSVTRSLQEDLAETQEIREMHGFDKPWPYLGPEWPITSVPFEYGWVSVRHRPFPLEELKLIIQDLTEALSLGYVRYLDFQHLEQQNRVLQETLHQLKETQNQLIMQEKMASLGDLVAGVAHEMNTPIGAINSMRDTLLRSIDKLKRTLETTFPGAYKSNRTIQSVFNVMDDANRVMASGAERVTHIVNSLRNFARLDEAEFQMAHIHEGIDSALTLLQNQLGENITVVKNYGDIKPIYYSPGQLNQVFMHLLKNAIQAIEGTGEIRIGLFEDDGKVCIQICDTGIGIPSEQLEHIFDFGFSATGSQVKMGFGLSTAYKIIQEHEGEIKVESEVRRGTEVTISLPIRETARGSEHMGESV